MHRIGSVSRLTVTASLVLCVALSTTSPVAGAEQTGPKRQVLAADRDRHVIALIDGDGHVLWKHQAGPIHDAQLLDSGNILFQTNYQSLLEVDRGGKTVWQYNAKSNGNESKAVEVHGFQRLP